VFITETWLNSDVTDRLLDPNDEFVIFRKDRVDHNGGGVCAIVRKSLNVRRVNIELLDARIELLGLDIVCSPVLYRYFVVYRPPDSSRVYEQISGRDYMSAVVEGIERNINTKGPTVIVGDFNCPDVRWDDSFVPNDEIDLQLYSFATANGFTQVVNEPTRGDNLLDLVLINQPFSMPTLNVVPPFGTSDHNCVNFTILVDNVGPAQVESPKRRYLWKQGDYAAMSQYLNDHDWSHMISVCLTPDDLWSAFSDVVHKAIEMFVPSVEVRNSNASRCLKNKYPSHIRALCARKRCVWKQMKRNRGNDVLCARYKQLAYEYKAAVRNYESKREIELIDSRNVGTFYKYVNKRLHNSNASSVLEDSGSFVAVDHEKAEVFNSYFNSVNVDDDGLLPDFPRRAKANVSLDAVQFTEEKIHKFIRKLKPKLTCDPEGFPPTWSSS